MKDKLQRGQALILIALAFVGLAGFIGLAVDGGILYSNVGHLRKAVDSAALAAANQFREGLQPWQLEASAKEFLDFNGLDSATAHVYLCEESINPGGPYGPYNDSSLCLCENGANFGDTGCTTRDDLDNRKLVRVEGTLPVDFAFLPIIGFDSIPIHAEAVSETAALDLVLVIDTSPSMAYDLCSDTIDNDGDGTPDDCKINDNQVDPISESDPATCNGVPDPLDLTDDNRCQPFSDVREAARFLINRMYFPYDRLSIVTFSFTGNTVLTLQDGDNWTDATAALNSLEVDREPNVDMDCPDYRDPGIKNPAGCPSTNTAGGIRNANQELASNGRQEAVWIMILLSDGAANAARTDPPSPEWICPGSTGAPDWIQPFCRDVDPATRHNSGDAMYDPDDRARDMADLAGCYPTDPSDPNPGCPPDGGNGVVMFTVGLGNYVTENDECDTDYYSAAECDQAKTLGEELLRYVANVGDDGDPRPSSDPCASVASGHDCGNYYYSPTGSGVLRVFEAIAGRIFTRITH